MEGSIPECVWSMSNLTVLNLAGNGFRGRIGSVSSMSSLLSLTLSHNHLGGEIPLWLQEKAMLHLDLSHNKLMGDLNGFKRQGDLNPTLNFQSSNQSLALIVNRLSGGLSSSFERYGDLDILSGNLFGCDYLPKNDANSDSLSCGSEQYDQSMITMGGVLGMMASLILLYPFMHLLLFSHTAKGKRRLMSRFLLRCVRFLQSYSFHRISTPRQSQEETNIHSPSHHFQSTVSFGSLLSHLMLSACALTALCLLLTLPVYVLKQSDVESTSQGDETKYVTHTHMYNWLWTMAFVSGTTPAIILLVACFVCVSSLNVVIKHLGGNEKPSPPVLPLSLEPVTDQGHTCTVRITAVWTIFLVNIAVFGAVNGLYIWSTLLDLPSDVRLWIQLSFALFSSLWSAALRRGLPYQIKESKDGVWLFICLNVMNSVLIPCVVTALSTPSCYQVSQSVVLSPHC
jgi:hypothetical protein